MPSSRKLRSVAAQGEREEVRNEVQSFLHANSNVPNLVAFSCLNVTILLQSQAPVRHIYTLRAHPTLALGWVLINCSTSKSTLCKLFHFRLFLVMPLMVELLVQSNQVGSGGSAKRQTRGEHTMPKRVSYNWIFSEHNPLIDNGPRSASSSASLPSSSSLTKCLKIGRS